MGGLEFDQAVPEKPMLNFFGLMSLRLTQKFSSRLFLASVLQKELVDKVNYSKLPMLYVILILALINCTLKFKGASASVNRITRPTGYALKQDF